MTREIEFRGRLKSDGSWVYGDLLHDNRGGCYIFPIDSRCLSLENEVVSDTIGQFTGRRDNHGKKIYEGDVVRRKDSAYGIEDTGVVKFDCLLGAFVLECEIYGRTYKSTFKKGFSDNDGKCTIEGTYSYELLGNIYNNPELLDNESK